MEDKRTLLAFLIIGLILLVLPYYYDWMGLSPSQEERPEAPEVGSSREGPSREGPSRERGERGGRESAAATPTIATPRVRPSVKPSASVLSGTPDFQPRLIRVTTPLLEMSLSTRGGEVVSVRMARYDREEGDPVELVPEFGRGLILSLRPEGGSHGTGQDLSLTEFVPDREFIAIGAEEQATLLLRADLGMGRYVEKELHFYGDRYGVDMKLNYAGFDEQTFAWLGWDGGIAKAEKVVKIDEDAMRSMAYVNESLTELRADEDEVQHWQEKGVVAWAGVRNKYFLTCLAPSDEGRHWVELSAGAFETDPELSYRIGSRLSADGSMAVLFYAGPLDYEEVKGYDVDMERAMDLGWPIVREVSKLLLVLLVAAHVYIPNYGFLIILFAVAFKEQAVADRVVFVEDHIGSADHAYRNRQTADR